MNLDSEPEEHSKDHQRESLDKVNPQVYECSARDGTEVFAFAKSNSCRDHMAKREQSQCNSEMLTCQGETGSREVKLQKVFVGLFYISRVLVVHCVDTILRVCTWVPDWIGF